MNWDRIEGKWDEYKGRVKQKWAKLTDDDLALIGGKKDELIGKVKERYGLAKDKAEEQIDEWTRSIGSDRDDSPSYPPTGSGNSRGGYGGMKAAGREGEGSGKGGAGSGGAAGGGGREGGREGGQGGRENTGREGQDRQGQGGSQRDQGGSQPDRSGRGGQEPGNRPDPNRDAVREPKKG
jgi:uncharacterized protein YjbJ (UPF0337 family)